MIPTALLCLGLFLSIGTCVLCLFPSKQAELAARNWTAAQMVILWTYFLLK